MAAPTSDPSAWLIIRVTQPTQPVTLSGVTNPKPRVLVLALIAITVAAALVSCAQPDTKTVGARRDRPASPSPSIAPPPPTPTPPPRPVGPVSFASAAELVAALNSHGLPCGPAETVENPTYAKTMIDCGREVVAATYATHQQAANAFKNLLTFAAGTGIEIHMAVGVNWTVSGDDPSYVQRVAETFGAEYRSARA